MTKLARLNNLLGCLWFCPLSKYDIAKDENLKFVLKFFCLPFCDRFGVLLGQRNSLQNDFQYFVTTCYLGLKENGNKKLS